MMMLTILPCMTVMAKYTSCCIQIPDQWSCKQAKHNNHKHVLTILQSHACSHVASAFFSIPASNTCLNSKKIVDAVM